MEELGGRFFVCRNCGKPVLAVGSKDKRSVFCSKECERIYWKRGEGSRKKKRERAREVYIELEKVVESAVNKTAERLDTIKTE